MELVRNFNFTTLFYNISILWKRLNFSSDYMYVYSFVVFISLWDSCESMSGLVVWENEASIQKFVGVTLYASCLHLITSG